MEIIEQLTRDEGVVLNAYQDSLGYWTIGIGRMIDKRKGGGISLAEAKTLLANDVQKVNEQLAARLPWTSTLDDARKGVLTNMAFNMGIENLILFKRTLACVQN